MGNSARTPRGINHVVLNVTNLEVSHRFWTETMGFRCVAALKQEPGRPRPKMRFYSGVDSSGDVTHHDLALMEIKAPATNGGKSEAWTLQGRGVGLNHVAIAWPDRESWLAQIQVMQGKGGPFPRPGNPGRSQNGENQEPAGHGVQELYERP